MEIMMKEAQVLGVLYYTKQTKYSKLYQNFLSFKDKAYKRSEVQTQSFEFVTFSCYKYKGRTILPNLLLLREIVCQCIENMTI